MNYTQIYTQMVRPKINTDYVRRKRVQSVPKELNNRMKMTLGVCLFVWAVNGRLAGYACCLCK